MTEHAPCRFVGGPRHSEIFEVDSTVDALPYQEGTLQLYYLRRGPNSFVISTEATDAEVQRAMRWIQENVLEGVPSGSADS